MIENVGIWSLLYTIPIVVSLKLLNDSRKRKNSDAGLYLVKQFNKWQLYKINDNAIEKLIDCNTTQEVIKLIECEKLK